MSLSTIYDMYFRVAISSVRHAAYVESIRDSIESKQLTDKAQMVVTIVPNDLKERYDAIKKICCVDIGSINNY